MTFTSIKLRRQVKIALKRKMQKYIVTAILIKVRKGISFLPAERKREEFPTLSKLKICHELYRARKKGVTLPASRMHLDRTLAVQLNLNFIPLCVSGRDEILITGTNIESFVRAYRWAICRNQRTYDISYWHFDKSFLEGPYLMLQQPSTTLESLIILISLSLCRVTVSLAC